MKSSRAQLEAPLKPVPRFIPPAGQSRSLPFEASIGVGVGGSARTHGDITPSAQGVKEAHPWKQANSALWVVLLGD
jgi:hypothetical protein